MRKVDLTGPTLLGQLVADARGGLVRAGGCPIDAFTWRRAIGERIASRSCPEQLRGGVLTLRVASSVWAQELSLLSTSIIERLAANGFVVKTIRCKVGSVEKATRPKTARSPASLPPIELPRELAKQLDRIEDADLRTTIETAARAQLQRVTERTLDANERLAKQRASKKNTSKATAAVPESSGARGQSPRRLP